MSKIAKSISWAIAVIAMAIFAYGFATYSIETPPTHEQIIAGIISAAIIVVVGAIFIWWRYWQKSKVE